MKEIRTEEAVGHVLCHDITQIIKDEKKGVLFKKGHIVKEEDIRFLSESAAADACAPGNPKEATVDDIEKLYRSLL